MLNRVYLLVTSPDAAGGIARATATLANHLVETRPVEMIALYRRRRGALYPLDPRVKVRCLPDEATPAELELADLPTETPGGDRTGAYSALVDAVLPRVLRALEPGIVISTRAIFHLEIANHAPAHCITIGQDHTSLSMRKNKSKLQRRDKEEDDDLVTDVKLVAKAIGRLDRYVVLTEADAASYRLKFPEITDRLSVIRNPAPWPVLVPDENSPERQKVIVAAGKLGGRKGFDQLVRAYTPIAKERPDWQVHIYGTGPRHRQLVRLISEGDIGEYVILKGHTEEMERVLEEASIMVLTSKYEGLPMVIIEAMTKGVPVVSFDCPNGPAEMVNDGVTGRLVPNKDLEAFRSALLSVMDDAELRASMGAEALKSAVQFEVDRVFQTWQDLFESLEQARAESA